MFNIAAFKKKCHKIEKRHVRIILFMKVCMTVSFLAAWFLPPHHAAWVSAAVNTIWLWEL